MKHTANLEVKRDKMILGKSCEHYRDTKYLCKGSSCDLTCNMMKYFDTGEDDNLDEKESTQVGQKDLVWFNRARTIYEEEPHDE